MRKVKILKAIIDLIWWTSIIGLIVLVFIIIGVLTDFIPVSPNARFTTYGIDSDKLSFFQKSLLTILNLINLLIIYCIYLFRQVVHNFNSLKIFDEIIIKNFNKIGICLLIIGVFRLLNDFLTPIIMENHLKLELGVSIGIIALGLFSIILSEVFVVAKKATEENDLTI